MASIFPNFVCYSNCSRFRSKNQIVWRINFPGFGRPEFMDFPFAAPPIRDLMAELLTSLETHLGSSLQPGCALPPDVQRFWNPGGTNHASLHIRSGLPSSQVDFILGGWIQLKLPAGRAINITSLSTHLKPLTVAPHFVIYLIQKSPISFILILDLIPRVDLIMYPNYLKTYYEDTQLARHKRRLGTLPEVRPVASPSLFIGSALSPTAIVVSIETSDIGKVIRDHVRPIAKEFLQFWIESCACSERSMTADVRLYIATRDRLMKIKFIEILDSMFPMLFGQGVGDRVVRVLETCFKI